MAVERYGSKTDVVVKLVLVFFIALLSFSIGTFVGKKFSDNQHKLAQLEPGAHETTDGHGPEERSVASVHPDTGEFKPEKALTDEEIAKLAEEFVADDAKPADAHGEHAPADGHSTTDKNEVGHAQAKNDHATAEHEAPVKGHEPASTKEHAAPKQDHAPAKTEHAPAADHHAPETNNHHAPDAALKPADRMAHGQSPVVANPKPAPSRIPSSLPQEVASSALGKFTVQVAAYSNEKEAQTMATDLKSKGFSAFYVSANVKGTNWYRVSVGLFTTQKEAEAYKKDLLARAKVSSAIVQKVTSAE